MIKQIIITKLFGRFNYNIRTKEDSVTIITGPNGYGKSTILTIINALSQGNFSYFFELDFYQIIVYFDNLENIKILKSDKGIKFNNIEIDYDPIRYEGYVSDLYRAPPWITRISRDMYIDRRNGARISEEELPLYLLFSNDSKTDVLRETNNKAYRDFRQLVTQIKKCSGEVRLISEQRLIRRENKRLDEEQVVEVIKELPEKLKSEINSVCSEYSKVANSLDGSYPKRLFSAQDGIKTASEFTKKLEEANSKFNKLSMYNLVDMPLIEKTRFDIKFSEALKIYFDDFSEKYVVFESLIKKLDLFTQIINERLTFKKIIISKQSGFEIVDIENSNRKLKLSQLSSGEKQEIVLFYDLIFNTKSELLLLIDEPEISLHISWQKKFMDDLLKVAKGNNLQVIVATHSPQIISNHWEIQIDLGELYGN